MCEPDDVHVCESDNLQMREPDVLHICKADVLQMRVKCMSHLFCKYESDVLQM